MANPAMPTVPEVRYEKMTGEQLAHDLASLPGRSVTDIQNEGVHVTLTMMNAAGELPFDRPDLLRLARGESYVRPIESARVIARNGGRTLVVDGEIAPSAPLEAMTMTSNQLVDANLGTRPDPRTAAMLVQPNAEQTASAGIPPTVPPPGTLNPESLHLMNETLTTHRFSRNGPVNREVSAALSRMDMGKDVTKVWQRLDEYVTTDSQTECHKIEMDAGAIANRLHDAQAERMFLEKGHWHIEWKLTANAKENVAHDLVNVYDWIMLPTSVGEKFFRNGTIELSKFPCHQLNGSFSALSAMRKTVQWYCQGCFDENADYEGVVFVVRRRSKN
eukprot:s1310_g8.t2